MIRKLIVLIVVVGTFLGFRNKGKELFSKPNNWPEPNYNFISNPLSKAKIELGKALFYDPLLSANNTISCASCHSQYNAFAHADHALSHGIDDRIGTRNAPTLINLAWNKTFMWDGAIHHLDVQALAPISHHDEMDENIENVVQKLMQSPIYPKLFKKAFPGEEISGANTLRSISSFLLTLVSNNSKYDSVMLGRTQFNYKEAKGYEVFKTHCSSCHTEPLFTNGGFENNGLPMDTELKDIGRMKITQNIKDSMLFKVPTLRNIEFSFPYMHDGRFTRLNEVINHYTVGIKPGKTLSTILQQQIKITSDQKVELIAFLLTLTDKTFLFNPDYSYPKKTLNPKTKD